MKRSKSRSSLPEPYQSPISDVERQELIQKTFIGALDNDGVAILSSEIRRSTRKMSAATEQLGGSFDVDVRFADAERSASSASGTMETMIPALEFMMSDGAKARRTWRKGGHARHDQFSTGYERRERWKKLRHKILANWHGSHQPGERELARLIAADDPDGPAWEAVRSYLKALKKKVGQQRR